MSAAGTWFWRRHRWIRWVAAAIVIGVAALTVTLAILARHVEPFLHTRLVEALEQRFQSRVELDSFHVSLRTGEDGEWGVWARGAGLRIWPRAQAAEVAASAASQPLIRLDAFSFQAPLRYTNGAPIRINQVRFHGLIIHIPRRLKSPQANNKPRPAPPAAAPSEPQIRFHVQSVACTNARLEIETTKLPLVFEIARFKVDRVATGGKVHFTADLTNPRPRGAIHATGVFGPWQFNDPGETPLQGEYTFTHADLGTFRGIGGLLSSAGNFQGALRSLQVEGTTVTPDFHLDPFGTAVPLRTSFQARVDGTSGDTWLETVDATLGNSHLVAKGQVVRVLTSNTDGPPRSKGHDIALDIQVDRGHIEDFLRLLSHSGTPLLTGNLELQTRVHVPPGAVPVHDRMELKGKFSLDQAEFTSATVQQKIRELSLRGQGRARDAKSKSAPDVHSKMQSRFTLANGEITLPDLIYAIPGASIQLRGTYAFDRGKLDFIGYARTQATISQMVGGWKGMLLKPADRLFKRGGAGASIPIRIGGTRENPDFDIDFKRLIHTAPQPPNSLPIPAAPLSPPAK